MDKAQYCHEVTAVLDSCLDRIRDRLRAAFAQLPPEARGVTLRVQVDQDGEGFLSIRIHLDGPDTYVLNRKIADEAHLFDTKMTEAGFDPPLPLMEPGRNSFPVQDALTDCAIEWLRSRWEALRVPRIALPITIDSIEGYGAIGPVRVS
ncbi:MAG: DUF6389 family protein [Burkholderiaceae bacterium]